MSFQLYFFHSLGSGVNYFNKHGKWKHQNSFFMISELFCSKYLFDMERNVVESHFIWRKLILQRDDEKSSVDGTMVVTYVQGGSKFHNK